MSYYNKNYNSHNKLIHSIDHNSYHNNYNFIHYPQNKKIYLQYNLNNINNTYNNSYNNIFFHGYDPSINILSINDIYSHKIINHINNISINANIDTIDDILHIINNNPINYDTTYNINLKALHRIKEPLIQLNNMIGMHNLKKSIVNQIIYFIQDMHKSGNIQNEFYHTVIYGPPGTGKTEIAKLLGNIFSKIGVLKKNYFKKITRTDLIAGYLGQTSIKTKDVINNALGGVLFIDEAYSLGNPEGRDSFAKECIDTLCEALSDHKDNLMVIVAGYEDELNKCFFSYNAGLDSRFTWRYKTDDYIPDELKLIFIKKINESGWKLHDDIEPNWFHKNKDYFKFYGRDMEILFSKTKIAHSKRVFSKPDSIKTTITFQDIKNGFKMYLDNNEVKNRKDYNAQFRNMYL